MTTTTHFSYQGLVDIDNAATFDTTAWLTEARGLSLRLLDAEHSLDKVDEDARAILESVAETKLEERLADLTEKGKAAKAATLKRVELEKKAATWSYLPDWYVDKYLEDNAELCLSHYHYIKHLYKQAPLNIQKWIDESVESFAAEIYEQRFQRLLAVEKAELEHEYEENNPQDVLGRFNNLHWEGCRRFGQERLTKIKRLKAWGQLDDFKATNMLRHTQELYGNKQLCKREYIECCMILNKQLGYISQYRKLKAELELADSRTREEFKPMPFEPSTYSIDMESGIDLANTIRHYAEDTETEEQEAAFGYICALDAMAENII